MAARCGTSAASPRPKATALPKMNIPPGTHASASKRGVPSGSVVPGRGVAVHGVRCAEAPSTLASGSERSGSSAASAMGGDTFSWSTQLAPPERSAIVPAQAPRSIEPHAAADAGLEVDGDELVDGHVGVGLARRSHVGAARVEEPRRLAGGDGGDGRGRGRRRRSPGRGVKRSPR